MLNQMSDISQGIVHRLAQPIAQGLPAVINLFRLLDEHPELLKDLLRPRSGSVHVAREGGRQELLRRLLSAWVMRHKPSPDGPRFPGGYKVPNRPGLDQVYAPFEEMPQGLDQAEVGVGIGPGRQWLELDQKVEIAALGGRNCRAGRRRTFPTGVRTGRPHQVRAGTPSRQPAWTPALRCNAASILTGEPQVHARSG